MSMSEINTNLARKGFSPDIYHLSPPYVILDLCKDFYSDNVLMETLHTCFARAIDDLNETSNLMDRFSSDLHKLIARDKLSENESLFCVGLLDIIFAFESWICITNQGREWGWSAVFSGFEETLHVVRNKVDNHLSPQKLIELSERINTPTIISSISKVADSDWVDMLYLNGYATMFGNSHMLSSSTVSAGLANGDTNLIFHPNADAAEAISLLISTLEEDPDIIFTQLTGWQSMVESRWNFVSPWASYDHSKVILKEMDKWLEENDYEETSNDFF